MAKYIQISPKIIKKDDKEELYSIKSLFPNNEATFSRLGESDSEFKTPKLLSSTYTVSTAMTLQFANVFSTSNDFDSKIVAFDASLYSIKDNSENPQSIIESTYWGCALRFVYKVWDIKSGFDLNTSSIGLAVEAGMARSEFQAVGIGLGINTFVSNLGALKPFKVLNRDDMVKLQNEIFVNQKDTIKKFSVPLAVTLRNNIANSSKSVPQSIIFAMRNIKNKNSLAIAMNKAAEKGYDAIWVSKTYERIVSDLKTSQEPLKVIPKTEDILKANQWLSLEKDIFDIQV